MQATYSRDVDALYLRIARATAKVASQREVLPGVILDLDRDGRLVGLEVLAASKYDDVAALESLGAPSAEMTLAEAADFSGLSASTLKNQLLKGRLPGRKVGRDWLVDINALEAYLENRSPAGRRSPSERLATKRRAKGARKTRASDAR